MFKSIFSIRNFLNFIFLFLLLFLVIFITNSILNAFKINFFSFNKNVNRIINRSEQLSKMAQEFDEKVVLNELGTNKLNGFYYRFDENLIDARHSGKIHKQDNFSKKINNICFEFNNRNDLIIKPVQKNFVLENGRLKYTHYESNILQSSKELNIDRYSIGEVEIKIKVKNTKQLILAWSQDSKAKPLNPLQTNYLTVWTIPDNKFHIYRVNVKHVFNKGFLEELKPGEPIRKIFLFPHTVPHDEIEIDYLRFISKKDKYAQKPFGVSYETINYEMRKALYMRTPHNLKYILNIPSEKSVLRFGMGILEKDNHVIFSIMIKDGNDMKVLFSNKISNSKKWHDAAIDLSQYANKKVEISFSCKGSETNIAFWGNPVLYTPPKERLNVVIVLEDALRSDRMSCYGYNRKTTPAKDIFAKKGIVFLNTFSQETYTRASCVSFMTSLYPSATGVWNASERLDDKYLTLAEIMRSQGYSTALFTQNYNAGAYVGLHQGFSTLFENKTVVGHRADGIYKSRTLDGWLKNNCDRNFFLYLHILDPHGPYDPPEEFIADFKKSFRSRGKRVKKDFMLDAPWIEAPTFESRNFLYDAEIRYNDFYFDSFLKALIKYNLLENTVIIFIADHGEHLGEHSLWDHKAPGYRQVLQVPMIMVYPKILPTNKRIEQPVQLLDIMPTILDIANIKKNDLLIQGDSLLPLIRKENLDFWNNRFCISEEVRYKRKDDKTAYGSIFYRNWHVLNSDKLNDTISYKIKSLSPSLYETLQLETRVFNLSKDKDEYFDLLNFLSDIIFNMKAQSFLKKYKKSNLATWRTLTKNTDQTIKYDPAALEQLRSLGYIK